MISLQVRFHAVELEGGGEVKLLATGVWRPHSLVKEPRPVPRPRISPEKIDVFKQVTSMCSDLVAHLKNIPHNNLTNESHCVDICHEEAIEEQSFSFHETEEVESSQGNTEDICPLESNQIDQDVLLWSKTWNELFYISSFEVILTTVQNEFTIR